MIESVNNERIKNYTKLNEKRERDKTGLFIISGKHLVEEAVKNNIVKELLILNGEDNTYDIPCTFVSESVMKKISNLDSAPKETAICYKPKEKEITGNVIILDSIMDPGNMGTIIRSAVAFNYATIIKSPNGVDFYNTKVLRSTEGMFLNLNLISDDLENIIKKLKKDGYEIYGTDVDGGEIPGETDKKHALIIGSEGAGMNDKLLKLCDKKLYIPMNQKCESLNAAVSCSIMMYELNRGQDEL